MVRTKLPKQWLYWAKKAGLKREAKRGGNWTWFYLRGRNRNWRVDMNGHFECSCPLEHFDRWANSRGAELPLVPMTEKQFMAAVKVLLEDSKDAR